MFVKIGHARHDENDNSRGGVAGDQTHGEVTVSDWYVHSKGWYVLRCKDSNKRIKIAEAMINACNNNFIGYDQSQRNTLFNEVRNKNYDPKSVTKRVETDCSALVRVCIAYAFQKDITGDWNTAELPYMLRKSNLFYFYTDNKYTKYSTFLRKGDILCTRIKGHTAVVLNSGAQAIEPTIAQCYNYKIIGDYITTQNVNLRLGVGTDQTRLLTIPQNTKVVSDGYYGKNGNCIWPKIYFELDGENFKGYCCGAYLKKI